MKDLEFWYLPEFWSLFYLAKYTVEISFVLG